MPAKYRSFLVIAAISAVALALRLIGVNWDHGAHLHPDERFLTMVGTALRFPPTWNMYIDPARSSMNPANVNFPFYVYGLLPVTLNKMLAIVSHGDNYGDFTIIGRTFSAFVDVAAMVFMYQIARLIEHTYKLDGRIKYVAAAAYAAAVLPIQLSHFFAVDTFLNMFSIASVYFALKALLMVREHKRTGWRFYTLIALGGLMWGAALASKVTALFVLPLIGLLVLSTYKRGGKILPIIWAAGIWSLVGYFTVRIANPYMFQTANILDPHISELFIKNIRELRGFDDPNGYFPPAIQWMHAPAGLYSFYNLVLYGVGLPYFILVVIGIARGVSRRRLIIDSLIFWSVCIFAYQSVQFSKPMRYLLFIYPYMAYMAAYGCVYLWDRIHRAVAVFAALAALVWPLAYMSVYLNPHSRITASGWIYTHIRPGAPIAVEHWDDALPLSLDAQHIAQSYVLKEAPVFGPDQDPQKWSQLYQVYQDSSFYILSSNRAWRSIMRAPDKYPVMSKYYNDLFAGRTEFYKVATFASYPSLRYMGIPVDFDDSSADESFTVYDHPVVYVFAKGR